MKKIVALILFAFSISFVNAQKPEETIRLEKFNLKPIESVFDEQAGKIDRETRALRVNLNEYLKSEVNEASEIALSYLQRKRDTYGLSNNSEDFKIAKTVESPSGKYVYFNQYVNDIPVFATNFTVYINKENMVTYALNEFRNVAKYNEVRNNPSILNSNVLEIAYEYLNIVEQFVTANKHLPEIATANEMIQNGVNMGEFQIQLLQKIEELTLYIIELKKEIDELKK